MAAADFANLRFLPNQSTSQEASSAALPDEFDNHSPFARSASPMPRSDPPSDGMSCAFASSRRARASRTRAVAAAMPGFPASPAAISFDICGSSNRAHQRAKSFCGEATGNPVLLIHAFGGSDPAPGVLSAHPTTTHEKRNNATRATFEQKVPRCHMAACRFRKCGPDRKTAFLLEIEVNLGAAVDLATVGIVDAALCHIRPARLA